MVLKNICVAPGDTCVKLFAVGDTGLKTGWVRCRHGAGRGGAGRGGVVTYFAGRIVPQYNSFFLAPENVCHCVCLYSLHREELRKLILR